MERDLHSEVGMTFGSVEEKSTGADVKDGDMLHYNKLKNQFKRCWISIQLRS